MPPTPRPDGPKKKASVKVPGSGDDSNRRLLIMVGIAAAVVLIAGGLGFALFGGGGSDGGAGAADATKQLEAAGCTVTAVKSLPSNDHSVVMADGTSKKWNTSPPTSGPHYSQPALWGSYKEPLLQGQVVHNLEHGGIFIQYGKDVPQATIDQLQAFYEARPNGTLLAPFPSLGSEIAIGAWTTKSPSDPDDGTAYLAKCTDFDEAAYAAFFAANQFKGPERFRKESMLPGQ